MEQKRSRLFLLVAQLSIALDEANTMLRLNNLDKVVRSNMDLICPADVFGYLSELLREANARLKDSKFEVVYIPASIYYESLIKEDTPEGKFWKTWYLTKTEKINGRSDIYEILCAYLLPRNIHFDDDELEKFRPTCIEDIHTYITKDDSDIKVIVWSDVEYSWSSVITTIYDIEWSKMLCQCPHFEGCGLLQGQDSSIAEFWK
ncbi:MAG: hypothetical protein PHZ07_01530 [Patescibacteria group bacterium]|nr:hypothetical protein [Patescibacteria group bacterium]MDD4695128.1 hypothetical protein [Patescibacteria group bacterium]